MLRVWSGSLAFSTLVALGILPATAARVAPEPPKAPAPVSTAPDLDARKAAVKGSITLIQRGAAAYIKTQDCFSCHHQALPLMTCASALQRGLEVDSAKHQAQINFTIGDFAPLIPEMRRGVGVPGGNDAAGYAVAGLAAAGYPADQVSEALAEFLIARQVSDGHWMASAERVPLEGSEFTSTALALEGIKAYAPARKSADVTRVRERAAAWLKSQRPKDTEDMVYQIRAYLALGDEAGARLASEALKTAQRPDGGWAQTPRLKSDAYATGQSLIALSEAGAVKVDDPAYTRGVSFLTGTQLKDGSWRVVTRARPVQTFFDNGDPHGKSQFISFAATNLAAQAILKTIPAAPAR